MTQADTDQELRELLRRVKRLEIRARSSVGDLAAGQYRSRFRGQGMEFDQVREYSAGDDIRSIDWNVTARAGKPFVKTWREERELSINLLVDCSGSMSFGGIQPWSERTKALTAAEAASIIAITALRNQDKVGLLAFSELTELHIPCRRGRNHTLRLVRELLSHTGANKIGNISHALDELRRVHKRRSVCFLISDFLDPPFALAQALQQAKRRHDIVGIRIREPAEDQLPTVGGPLVLADPEGGGVHVFSGGKTAARRYENLMREQREQVQSAFISAGCELVECSTDSDAFSAIQEFFRRRRHQVRA